MKAFLGSLGPYSSRICRRLGAVTVGLGLLTAGAAADQTIESEIQALLDEMTIEEKVGQMTQVTLAVLYDKESSTPNAIDPDKLREAIQKYHVGSILNTGSRSFSVDEWHEVIRVIQDEALEARVPIPVLYGIDAIHGTNYTKGSTLFPHNIGLAAARSTELVADVARVTAMETRASGIRWNFDPVLDVGRNPLWSRFEETFGEDAWLTGLLGSAAIRAYEQDDLSSPTAVASCMKHYLGYSDPANGKDRTPAYIQDVELREHHLPPFEAAVKAGSATIMINSASINGMPVHGSKKLLTDVLRGELGFEGLVVSDWEDVKRLHTRHRIAETPREAVRMGVEAGIDMSMVPHDFTFAEHLVDLVKSGEVSEERLDKSVAIVLRLKHRLGLFDDPYPEAAAAANFGRPEYKDLALRAARETITLLKNTEATLPLAKDARLLVAGPAAWNVGALHGSWSYTWQGRDESAYAQETLSLAEALLAAAGAERIVTMGKPAFDAPENVDTATLVELAADADAIVLALGEHSYAESPGALDDLNLPDDQVKLALAAIGTGKPVIVVLLEGRPRVVRKIVGGSDAILQAYRPGSRGAEAIVDVLYGDYNPSGVLPYSYPQFSGDITPYDRRVLANVQQLLPGTVTYGGYKPQWPFGHGLSYTSFAISDLGIDKETVGQGDTLEVTVTVTNTGDRDGHKVIDLYVSDIYASLSPAEQKLRRTTKIHLRSKESREVRFTLDASDLSFVNAELQRVVEPGEFRVTVGSESVGFEYR
jgi:beta-glucosidase